MLGGRLALRGDVVARRGDLLLLDLQQHLGRLQLVVGPRLLADDHVAHAVAAGELLGRLRVEQGGERDQLGVALGVHVGDRGGDLLALGLRVGPALGQGRLGGRERGLGGGELGLHLRVALLRHLDLAARGGELGLGGRELVPGRVEAGGGLLQVGARLVEVALGAPDLALDLLLLVLEVVGGLRDREGGHTQRHREGHRGGQAAVGGTGQRQAGKGTHRGKPLRWGSGEG